jgi:hypothetical protein
MSDKSIDRKEFLSNVGKCCLGTCLCAIAGGIDNLYAQESDPQKSQPLEKPRAEERIKFAEQWVKRFFAVMDSTLDETTRKQLMMANGKACYRNWIEETKQEIKPVTLEQFTSWVKNKVKDGSYQVEGNVIHFQYMAAAETGLPSDDNACLCPLVETKPKGLSTTFCICSVGYVKEMHELYLKRCKFRITVA